MTDEPKSEPKPYEKKKVAIACQGGGIHASFAVGVLCEILTDIQKQNRFELVGLSGTLAGALCTLMVWYGLAPKNGQAGSVPEAIDKLNGFWDSFAATRRGERCSTSFHTPRSGRRSTRRRCLA
jgi:NTE family protein